MALEEGRFFVGSMTDKRHEADGLAEYCRRFLSSGVWATGTNLQVSAADGMSVAVGYGSALVDGYPYRVRDNSTGLLTLTAAAAHATLPRVDRVVVRKDAAALRVYAYIKAGTPAASPTAPALERTDTVYEISLAKIAVAAGASSISVGNITDERADTSVCGISGILPALLAAYLLTSGGTISGDLEVGGALTRDGNTVWDSDNDGAGSGLDADTVDNHHVSDLMKNYSSEAHPISYNTEATFPHVNAFGSGSTQGAAALTFYRNGNFAAHFGLDTDNVLKVGGFSMGSNAYAIHHQGNLQYSTGNWTPRIYSRTNGANAILSASYGRYIRIGNVVHLFGAVVMSSKNGMTGNIAITDLPFTNGGMATAGSIGIALNLTVTTSTLALHMDASVNRIDIMRSSNAIITVPEIADNFGIYGFQLTFSIL